jgi:hypothetical protein
MRKSKISIIEEDDASMSWTQVKDVKKGSVIAYGDANYTVVRNDFGDLLVQASDKPFPQSLKAIADGRDDDFNGMRHEVYVQSGPVAPLHVGTINAQPSSGGDIRASLEQRFATPKAPSLKDSIEQRFARADHSQSIGFSTNTPVRSLNVQGSVVATQNDLASLRQQLSELRSSINDTNDRVEELEYEEEDDFDHDFADSDAAQRIVELEDRLAKLEHGAIQSKLNSVQKQSNGGNNNMNIKNILGNFTGLFGKVEGQFALSPVGVAVRSNPNSPASGWVVYNKATGELTDVQNMTFDFSVPAFRLPVQADQVAVGDVVVNDGKYQYVVEVNDDYVTTICPSARSRSSVLPVKNMMLQKAFYTVVKVIDFTDANATQAGGFNPMLLMAMDKGNKSDILPFILMGGGLGNGAGIDPMTLMLLGDNTDDLLPLLLMQQSGVAGGNALQGILPLLLLSGDKGGSGGGMKDILLMQALAGGQGGSPFGNLFGGAPQATAQTVAAPKEKGNK